MSRPAQPMHLAVRLAALGALLFTAASYAAPLLADGFPGASHALRTAFSPLCHQRAERSIPVAGAPQAVCGRCAGLYLGGTLGLIAAPFVLGSRRRLRFGVLALACAPTAIDALLPWFGLPQLPIWPRLSIAVPAGFAAGLFLALGVDGLARELGASRASPPTGPRFSEDLDAEQA